MFEFMIELWNTPAGPLIFASYLFFTPGGWIVFGLLFWGLTELSSANEDRKARKRNKPVNDATENARVLKAMRAMKADDALAPQTAIGKAVRSGFLK